MYKKSCYLLFLICLVFVFSACSNEKSNKKENISDKRQVTKYINQDLINNLVGDWIGDDNAIYPTAGEKKISEKSGFILYDNESLEITSTENNTISTQTMSEKPFFFDFKVDGDKLIVYQSYPIPEGSVGGDLAPEYYIRVAGKR